MGCQLCADANGTHPIFDAGKCESTTLLNKEQKQTKYNDFAHGVSKAKCACTTCKPERPGIKRGRSALATAVGINGVMSSAGADPPVAPLASAPSSGDLGDLAGWDPA